MVVDMDKLEEEVVVVVLSTRAVIMLHLLIIYQ